MHAHSTGDDAKAHGIRRRLINAGDPEQARVAAGLVGRQFYLVACRKSFELRELASYQYRWRLGVLRRQQRRGQRPDERENEDAGLHVLMSSIASHRAMPRIISTLRTLLFSRAVSASSRRGVR